MLGDHWRNVLRVLLKSKMRLKHEGMLNLFRQYLELLSPSFHFFGVEHAVRISRERELSLQMIHLISLSLIVLQLALLRVCVEIDRRADCYGSYSRRVEVKMCVGRTGSQIRM